MAPPAPPNLNTGKQQKKKKQQQQLSLTSFFTSKTKTKQEKENTAPAAAETAKTPIIGRPEPKFPVRITMVKKQLSTLTDSLDDAMFVNGKVIECLPVEPAAEAAAAAPAPATTSFQQPRKYRVLLDTVPSECFSSSLQTKKQGGGGASCNPKTTEEWTEQEVEWGVTLYQWIGTKVAKYFGAAAGGDDDDDDDDDVEPKLFVGQVRNISKEENQEDGKDEDPKLYFLIHYFEDDDSEEMELDELKGAVQLYKKECGISANSPFSKKKNRKKEEVKKKKKKKAAAASATTTITTTTTTAKSLAARRTLNLNNENCVNGAKQTIDDDDDDDDGDDLTTPHHHHQPTRTSPRRRSASRSRINYCEMEDDDDDDDNSDNPMEEDEAATKQRSVKRKIAPKNSTSLLSKKSKTNKSKESMEDEMIVDDNDDSMMMDEVHVEPKAKHGRAATTKNNTKPNTKVNSAKNDTKTSSNTGGSNSEKLQAELKERVAKEKFDPKNNPQVMPEAPYVDPVGVDPTHGIVERIISAQVRKVGGLLQRVFERADEKKENEAGELTFPIRLQTACSGTDAPSIALGLVKESLDKLYKDKPGEEHGFQYDHGMSCEIEPFKQAYIGRNFPGVTLFPDITKLTASEEVLDVYGRPQCIPDGNLFVAGTSCKDFSMLKTRDRLDIEDKGTSGETFLAAVEFLDTKRPPLAIFENVENAPWEKMSEYITGRIALSKRNDTTAIKAAGKKANADAELKFSVNAEGQYVAEEVPRQVGIRAGSIVEGFVKHGDDATNVRALKTASKSNKFITLGEMAKNHKINLEMDVLVFHKKARYCTHLSKVDTKEYGLPQTRQRRYLFIWRSQDPEDDLGEFLQEILDHLKTPLLHAMDAFLLPDTHDRIRCFREALRSGPGLMVKRQRAKELDFWDWELSHVLDLSKHLVFREANGISERSRWLTGWDTRGRKALAPGLWRELFDVWNMRRLDMIDCFGIAAIRDAISRDPLHHAFTWDLSQNVTRAPFRMATVGVSGCVTPGGELLLPHRGRTLMGYEKLLLQGIPFSRLLLGPESEVQLSDLAGNAMSVPVVCATLLAAICAPQLRRERRANANIMLSNFRLISKHDAADGAVLAERGDFYGETTKSRKSDEQDIFVNVFSDIAKELARDCYFSSALCICETSGTTTNDSTILECQDCGFSICHACSSCHQTNSHNLEEIQNEAGRPDPHAFERKLRCKFPPVLRLSQEWEVEIDNASGLNAYSFQIQQVERKRGYWEVIYGAWEDFFSGRQVAEIRVVIGRTGTLDKEFGVVAYLRCFGPAIRHENPFRGTLPNSARFVVKLDGSSCWEAPAISTKTCVLKLVGSKPSPSQRVQAGLNHKAFESLRHCEPQRRFIPNIQSRNSLTSYHPQWMTWPGTIDISGDDRVSGSYVRAPCQQTVVHSSLWCRKGVGHESSLYLFFRPDVMRSGLDSAVISTSPSYRDSDREICELKDWIPENALVAQTQETAATFIKWAPRPNLNVLVVPPAMSMASDEESFHAKVLDTGSPDSSEAVLCKLSGLPMESLLHFQSDHLSNDDSEEVVLDLIGRSGTQNAKRLSVVAAPFLLKYAAEGRLPIESSRWYPLPSSWSFGESEVHVPSRPVERWQIMEGRKGVIERVYDREQSNEYYNKLLSRPTAFKVKVMKSRGQIVVSMDPSVAAHEAAARLGGEKAGSIKTDFCLSELSSMGEPDTKEFRVPNSDAFPKAHVEGLLELPLYTRQAKALSRMVSIENGEVPFTEEERSENILPGIGWCLIGRATRKSPLRGGVLGDAIGSGKTVITIALIMQGVAKARANRDSTIGRSGATLVVVPPGLLKQWDDERKKFTNDRLKCISISCVAALKSYSVDEICSADMVIVPAGIIEEAPIKGGQRRPYSEHLSRKAGAEPIPPAPTYYSQREAPTIEGTWVRNMASGPEIYVGNKGSQRTRDAQAYYGHCYSEAIAKLRQKNFSTSEKGVPLEYFTWERVVIDECHETLVTGKQHEIKDDGFKEKARRGAREFLGVSQTDISKRPLVAAAGVWGLTGTPLLETEARVTELANLMGGTYLTGAAHHWRKEERESGRDLFLNQQEGTRSREYRCAVQKACHSYVEEACQRNRGEQLEIKLSLKQVSVNMSDPEGEMFLRETSDFQLQSYSLTLDQLGERAGAVLSITAKSKARHAALIREIDDIHASEPDTKIIVFANSSFGGHKSACAALRESGKKFCHLAESTTVQEQNDIIGWFRHADASELDRSRPRILLLSFEQAAGHNLQEACHNVIIFDPMYSGTDPVADASVEEQAVGRVMRQGQKFDVTVTRIAVKGPNGERCLDDCIIERNLDEETLRAATSNFD